MVISVLTICLVPKLPLGNAVPRSYASRALRLLHLNTCRGGHLNGNCVGKRSFRSVRSQAGAWERGSKDSDRRSPIAEALRLPEKSEVGCRHHRIEAV